MTDVRQHRLVPPAPGDPHRVVYSAPAGGPPLSRPDRAFIRDQALHVWRRQNAGACEELYFSHLPSQRLVIFEVLSPCAINLRKAIPDDQP